MPELCLHCEKAARTTYLRLCDRCAAQEGIRRLYRKTVNWTAERDARIQHMVERETSAAAVRNQVGPVCRTGPETSEATRSSPADWTYFRKNPHEPTPA